MSCRSENSNPTSGSGAGTPCDSTKQSCPPPPCNQAEITMPKGSLTAGSNPTASWLTTPCYHFDFQGWSVERPALTCSRSVVEWIRRRIAVNGRSMLRPVR
jgi:hypothetical protein